MPALADLALRAGGLLAVVAGAEVVAGVALLGPVLAGRVSGQRAGEGDLVDAGGPLHVDQGGIAAVDEVGGGEQAPEGLRLRVLTRLQQVRVEFGSVEFRAD